jgi:hypothetical protein
MTIDCKEEHGRLSVIKLAGRPCVAIAPSLFAGVDFSNLILNGLEGKRRVGISLPVKTIYMRDLRRDAGWLASEATKGDGPRVIAPWIASFVRVLIGALRHRAARGFVAGDSPVRSQCEGIPGKDSVAPLVGFSACNNRNACNRGADQI